ncbi:Major facilitator superfamily like protein [Argiope bruennichi]|uniref:Major facilitator superfamily like protein n=1 Tax=Argiope bruennichi TaxID=94029 RepID=A0A8T0E7R8_ARGBR|nr:Major facilitator superfamily like protein [Argiope bruennichi]
MVSSASALANIKDSSSLHLLLVLSTFILLLASTGWARLECTSRPILDPNTRSHTSHRNNGVTPTAEVAEPLTPTDDLPPNMGKRAGNNSLITQASLLDNETSGNNRDEKNLDPSDPTHFIIRLCKDYKISINKPLIPLKLALFTYYGAGSFMPSFITVLYKTRGVSLAELSTFTIIAPIFQFIGSALSGIVADKIGRSKPVLVTNLLLVTLTVLCILLSPKIDRTNCTAPKINLFCNAQQSVAQTGYNLQESRIDVRDCKAKCSRNDSLTCNDTDSVYRIFYGRDLSNISLTIYIDNSHYNNRTEGNFVYNVSALEFQNVNTSWCYSDQTKNCSSSCEINSNIMQCRQENTNYLLFVYGGLFILFLTTYSNTYRCMDVTAMFLAKEQNSDFGRERFFAISGNLLISPLAGYIAEVTSPVVGEKNYAGALYLFIGMTCFLFLVIYKLPVRVVSPGEQMWKKTLILLKNIDVVVFFIVIFILGTSWNFTKYFLFWYLEDMQAPSLLIGLITSVSALYGLPFLLTSKWWVKKISPKGIIILAFVAYIVNSTGYSFLRNPWFALALEATGILNYYLLWVAVVVHSHDIAPEGLTSTVITISGAIHYSIGKASSGLTGGLIMNAFGGRVAFRFNALLCLACVVLYGFYIFFRNRYTSMKLKIDPSPQNMKVFHIEKAENGLKL